MVFPPIGRSFVQANRDVTRLFNDKKKEEDDAAAPAVRPCFRAILQKGESSHIVDNVTRTF